MSKVMEIHTEDDLRYHFYPVPTGSVQFKVRAPKDAHIALTRGPEETEPIIEIIIAGWENKKSAIRKNKVDQVTVDTPGYLSANEFRDFFIRWDYGSISVGIRNFRGRSDEIFLKWTDPEPFFIGFVGVCTAWGATGTWKIEDGAEFNTPDKLQYKFGPVTSGSLSFEFKGPHNCHLCLTDGADKYNPIYEIVLGGQYNTQSYIRYNREYPDKVNVPTSGLLDATDYKSFLIQWVSGRIVVRDANQSGAPLLMEWVDPNPFPITHFGIRTGYGAQGQWRIQHYFKETAEPLRKSPPLWVDASNGDVPSGAVIAGKEKSGEPIYVARAIHNGFLIPGKLVKGHNAANISYNGREHVKDTYQVLIGDLDKWVPTSGDKIPSNAFPAGEQDEGEALFVGRFTHDNVRTPGKVHRTHKVCYIPYGGSEVKSGNYEVLVV